MLTDRQKTFCRKVVEGHTDEQACIQSGYSPNGARVTAVRLRKREDVAQEIERLRSAANEESIASHQEVCEKFTTFLRDDGLEVRDRIKAAESLAKLRGYEAPQRQEMEHKGGIEYTFRIVNDDEE